MQNTGDVPSGEALRGPAYLTAEDVATLFQVGKPTVYRWVDQGLLPAHRVGPRLLRFAPQDLESFYQASGRAT